MKNECHIYRQSIELVRQCKGKTITSLQRQIQEGQDKIALGKTKQGKVGQFTLHTKPYNSPERQLSEGQDNLREGRTIYPKARQIETR